MKKQVFLIFITVVIIALAGCASAPAAKAPAAAQKPVKKVNPVTIDFGPYWTGTIRMGKKANPDLGNNAEARFNSE